MSSTSNTNASSSISRTSSTATTKSKRTTTATEAKANRKQFVWNSNWNGHWTTALEELIHEEKKAGRNVHEITDAIHGAGGPSRWESVRDKMKEMFPGEHMLCDDDDDPLAGHDGEIR
jgi:hypothetical protein